VKRSLTSVACVLLLGCGGYQLLRPDAAREMTVSIVTLENDSLEPGLELTVTRALRAEFLRRRAPRLIADPSAADIVIRGRVEPLETRARSLDTVVLGLEYSVVLSLDLEIVMNGRKLWLDPSAQRDVEIYLSSADVEAARKNRTEALRRLSEILAGRIHDALDLQLVTAS
jgi:hypothetical protein